MKGPIALIAAAGVWPLMAFSATEGDALPLEQLLQPQPALEEAAAPAATPAGSPEDSAATPVAPEQSQGPVPTPPPAGDGTAPSASGGEEAAVPQAFPLERYRALWEKSPFMLASIEAVPTSMGLAQKYALTGIASIAGEPMVFLKDRMSQTTVTVGVATNMQGLSLVNIESRQDPKESTATVRAGGEVGVLKFDEVSMQPGGGMAPNTSPGMGVPQAGVGSPQPGANGNVFPQGTVLPAGVPGGAPGFVPPQVPQGGYPVNAQFPAVPVPAMPAPGQGQQGMIPSPPPSNDPPPRVIRRRAMVPASP